MRSDQEILAVEKIAQRLSGRFGSLRPHDVGTVVSECHARFADSPIRTYVPLLVEHAAQERLRAMAPADRRPEVFVTVPQRTSQFRLAFADGKAWAVL